MIDSDGGSSVLASLSTNSSQCSEWENDYEGRDDGGGGSGGG